MVAVIVLAGSVVVTGMLVVTVIYWTLPEGMLAEDAKEEGLELELDVVVVPP